ncbi:MAG: SpoIIE family protein phosphatase [Bacteroidota bacterium]
MRYRKLALYISWATVILRATTAINLKRGYTRIVTQSPHDPTEIFVGHLQGISVLKYENGQFRLLRDIKTPITDIQTMDFAEDGSLWIGTAVQGVGQLRFQGKGDSPYQFTPYDSFNGKSITSESYIHKTGNELFVMTREGVFRYDNEKLVEETRFKVGEDRFITTIDKDQKGTYWLGVNTIMGTNWLEHAIPQSDGTMERDSTSFLPFTYNSIVSVFSEPNLDGIWMVGQDGVYRYILGEDDAVELPRTVIRRVVSTKSDEIIFWGHYFDDEKHLLVIQPEQMILTLPYEKNSLTFYAATPEYGEEDRLEYSFLLSNHDEEWSKWAADPKKEYTELSEGQYELQVHSRDRFGNVSQIGYYRFIIAPPWYRTIPAYIAYVLLSAVSLFVIIRISQQNLQKEKFALEDIVQKRTKEVEEQKERILAQNKNLEQSRLEIQVQKDQLELSYQNVRLLSQIGQEIAAINSIEQLTETMYEKVNQLMDASGFGIGVCNVEEEKLEIRGFIEKGSKLPPDADSLHEPRLSVWCFKNDKTIHINARKEIQNYLNGVAYESIGHGEMAESIIYAPLRFDGGVQGVITVQSFTPNAYSEYEVNMVENLANYVSISIENALLYENLEEKVEERTAEVVRQNQEIAEKSKLLEQKNEDMEVQSRLLEKKNQDITSSINYAKRIQEAMLPNLAQVKANFPDSFVVFEPRDIISGDFYWFTEYNHPTEGNKLVVAAVDCTGHGVPGAFMYMIANELLNEVVNLVGEVDPGKILTKLHEGVRKDLRQYENDNRDGMDIALCVIDREKKTLDFAGAKNPLVYIQGGEFKRIRGDKYSIGGRQRGVQERIFTTHRIHFHQPTTFYIYSDGYQDQFGGPEGRKFTTTRFRSLLYNIYFLPMEEQKQILETTLRDWQGDKRQIDDILVMGFSI